MTRNDVARAGIRAVLVPLGLGLLGGHLSGKDMVHIQLLDALHVGEKLRGDFPDGDIVDINVLFADEIEQQVERPVVDLSHADREGKIADGRRCHGLSAGLGWLCH